MTEILETVAFETEAVGKLLSVCDNNTEYIQKIFQLIEKFPTILNIESVLNVFEQTISITGNYKIAFINIAMLCGEYDLAIEEIKNILENSETDLELVFQFKLITIQILLVEKKYDETLEYISSIDSTDTIDEILSYFKSIALLEKGDIIGAIETFKSNLNDLILLFEDHINLDDHIAKLKEMIDSPDTDEKNKAIYSNTLAWVLRKYPEKYDDCLQLVDKALEIIPDMYHFMDTKAYLLANSGNPENYLEALELCNTVIAQMPVMYYIWSRANLHSKMAYIEEAKKDYELVREKLLIRGFQDMTTGDVKAVLKHFSSESI